MNESIDQNPSSRIKSAIYTGPKGTKYEGRGVKDIEYFFRETGKKFDDILADQFASALKEGRTEIVVVDIGSGHGRLFSSFLSDPAMGEKSRQFLVSHPEFRLKMRGLTDSPTSQFHLKEKPFDENESKRDKTNRGENDQIDAQNIYFSITRNQTMLDFLRSQGIEKIDLVLATESLRYLNASVFADVVKTVVDKLQKGGEFIATGIVGSHPGFSGLSNERLNIRNIPGGQISWRSLVDTNTYTKWVKTKEQVPKNGNIEEERKAIQEAISFYKRLQVLSNDKITEIRQKLENDDNYKESTEREKLYIFANQVLSYGFQELSGKKNKELADKKRAILNQLDPSEVRLQYLQQTARGPLGFVIEKIT